MLRRRCGRRWRQQFQTSSPLKPLGQSKPNFYVESPWEGGTKVYINGPGHITKMTAMPIYGQNPSKIFFSITGCPKILKLSMQHKELKLYKVYINDDHGLTLTYFIARSIWVAYTFEWGKLFQSHLMRKTCSKVLNLTE